MTPTVPGKDPCHLLLEGVTSAVWPAWVHFSKNAVPADPVASGEYAMYSAWKAEWAIA